MFHLNVWLTVQDEANIDTVAKALERVGRMSHHEPGCLRWEAYQSEADPKRFLLVEHWANKEDWENHRQAEAVQTIYLPEVIPLVEREAHSSRRII